MGNNNPAECEANRLLPTRKKESVGEVLINFAQQAKQPWDIARGEVSGWMDDSVLIPCAVEEIDIRMKRAKEYTIVGDDRGRASKIEVLERGPQVIPQQISSTFSHTWEQPSASKAIQVSRGVRSCSRNRVERILKKIKHTS